MMKMSEKELEEEYVLLTSLEERKVKAFIQLYKEYADDLLIYAYAHLNNRQLAVEATSVLFDELWLKAKFKDVTPPIYEFLKSQMDIVCKKRKR